MRGPVPERTEWKHQQEVPEAKTLHCSCSSITDLEEGQDSSVDLQSADHGPRGWWSHNSL